MSLCRAKELSKFLYSEKYKNFADSYALFYTRKQLKSIYEYLIEQKFPGTFPYYGEKQPNFPITIHKNDENRIVLYRNSKKLDEDDCYERFWDDLMDCDYSFGHGYISASDYWTEVGCSRYEFTENAKESFPEHLLVDGDYGNKDLTFSRVPRIEVERFFSGQDCLPENARIIKEFLAFLQEKWGIEDLRKFGAYMVELHQYSGQYSEDYEDCFFMVSSQLIPSFRRFCEKAKTSFSCEEKEALALFEKAEEFFRIESLLQAGYTNEFIVDDSEVYYACVNFGHLNDGYEGRSINELSVNSSVHVAARIMDDIILWFDKNHNFLPGPA